MQERGGHGHRRVGGGAVAVLMAVALAAGLSACAAGSGSRVDDEFRRCLDQQASAPSPGCWRLFLDRYGDAASPGQIKAARELAAIVGDEDGAARVQSSLRMIPGAMGAGVRFPAVRVAHDECFRGWKPTGRAEADLGAMVERCGEPAGLAPLTEPHRDRQTQSGEPQTFMVPLRADRCYRVFAASDSGIGDLDALVMDPQGNVLAFDTFVDPAPILGPRAPFCPVEAGEHRLIFSVERGEGEYAFQLWQASAAEMEKVRREANRFPEACGQTLDTVDYGIVQVGMPIKLGRHRALDGDMNWSDGMEPLVGQVTRVTSLQGIDGKGCPVVTVDLDGGDYYWRVRDQRPAVLFDPNELIPDPPGGLAPIPRRCGFVPGAELYGPVGLGARITLGRHTPVAGEDNWAPGMDQYVGQPATVVRLRGVDATGCPVVGVDIDDGEYAWRIRDISPGGPPTEPTHSTLRGEEGSTLPPPAPPDPRSAEPGSAAKAARALEAVPNPGTDGWASAVRKQLVQRFDGDRSGSIDRVPELHAVPCMIWQTLDARLRGAPTGASLAGRYGFSSERPYTGDRLGVAAGIRELAHLRLKGCGL